jgi:hypothetical protein
MKASRNQYHNKTTKNQNKRKLDFSSLYNIILSFDWCNWCRVSRQTWLDMDTIIGVIKDWCMRTLEVHVDRRINFLSSKQRKCGLTRSIFVKKKSICSVIGYFTDEWSNPEFGNAGKCNYDKTTLIMLPDWRNIIPLGNYTIPKL